MSILVDMNDFDLREVSLVAEGMNELADAPVAKEKQPAADDMEKRLAAVLTSTEEGHQHGIHLRRWGDEAKVDVDLHSATAEGEDGGWHDHELMQAADGSWVVGMSAGHTHEVDGGALSAAAAAEASPVMKGEAEMDEELEKGTEDVSLADLATLIRGVSDDVKSIGERTSRLEKVSALPASERSVFDGLSKEAQDSYLEATSHDRSLVIAQAQKAAAEKTLGGDEDPLIAELRKEREEMAKERAEMAEAVKGLTAALRGSQLEKEAEEVLSFAPGKPEVKQAVLGKMHELAEENPEVGKEALEMLKALNDAGVYNWSAFGTEALKGVGSGSDVMKQAAEAHLKAEGTLSDPLIELNKMAEDYCTAHPEVTKAKAYQLQAQTPRGRELAMAHYASTPVRMS